MFDYFLEYYLGMARGVSYVPAQITTFFAVTSVVYWRFGDHQLDKIMLVLFTVVYACFFSKYQPRIRLVRSVFYLAGYMVAFSISEPLGVILQMVDERYWVWAQHLTWICVILLICGIVWFLRHFSSPRGSVVHPQFVTLLCVVSGMIIASQVFT